MLDHHECPNQDCAGELRRVGKEWVCRACEAHITTSREWYRLMLDSLERIRKIEEATAMADKSTLHLG